MIKSLVAAVAALTLVGGAAAVAMNWDGLVVIPEKRKPLLALLNDPESAKFRNERVSGWGALCGEFNSKNASGGYPGYTRFYVHGSTVATEGEWPPSGMASTQAAIERLDVRIASLENPPRTENQEKVRRFEAQWAQLCK